MFHAIYEKNKKKKVYNTSSKSNQNHWVSEWLATWTDTD